jgi:hypothetical protein
MMTTKLTAWRGRVRERIAIVWREGRWQGWVVVAARWWLLAATGCRALVTTMLTSWRGRVSLATTWRGRETARASAGGGMVVSLGGGPVSERLGVKGWVVGVRQVRVRHVGRVRGLGILG